MSWAIIISDIPNFKGFEPAMLADSLSQNQAYGNDMLLALHTARSAGLKSCTLAGGRTPSPDGEQEVVDIAVHGLTKSTDYVQAMKKIVTAPEAVPDSLFAMQQIERMMGDSSGDD